MFSSVKSQILWKKNAGPSLRSGKQTINITQQENPVFGLKSDFLNGETHIFHTKSQKKGQILQPSRQGQKGLDRGGTRSTHNFVTLFVTFMQVTSFYFPFLKTKIALRFGMHNTLYLQGFIPFRLFGELTEGRETSGLQCSNAFLSLFRNAHTGCDMPHFFAFFRASFY